MEVLLNVKVDIQKVPEKRKEKIINIYPKEIDILKPILIREREKLNMLMPIESR